MNELTLEFKHEKKNCETGNDEFQQFIELKDLPKNGNTISAFWKMRKWYSIA